MREKIGYFHADYRDGRVHIGGKVYQAGIFATHLLNQYYKDNTAARLAVYKWYNWHTAETLSAGYLDTDDFIKAGEEILLILQTLPKLQPFTMLDTKAERERIAELFAENNADIICDYFNRKAAVHQMMEADRALDLLPKEYDKDFFIKAENLINDVIYTLDFYDSISEDMRIVFENLRVLVSRTDKESAEDVTVDYTFDPCYVLLAKEKTESVFSTFDSLPYREREVVRSHIGFCPDCHSMKSLKYRPHTFQEIAYKNELFSAEAAENIYHKACDKMKAKLKEKGITQP